MPMSREHFAMTVGIWPRFLAAHATNAAEFFKAGRDAPAGGTCGRDVIGEAKNTLMRRFHLDETAALSLLMKLVNDNTRAGVSPRPAVPNGGDRDETRYRPRPGLARQAAYPP